MYLIKKIDFNVYLNNFYDLIRVNTPNNEQSQSYPTPIFYKIINNQLNISFSFANFYIETSVDIDLLTIEYNKQYSDGNMLFDDAKKLDFFSWMNNKYMDERGIKEL